MRFGAIEQKATPSHTQLVDVFHAHFDAVLA